MKKYYIYLILIFSILVIPKNVSAAGLCDNKTMADYRELAGNIKIYTDYNIIENQATFDVIITNLPKDVYIVDTYFEKTYHYADFTTETELVLKGFPENRRLTFQIFMDSTGCYGGLLANRYVTLPNYNEYSSDEVCNGALEYSLCQRWGSVSVSYNDFVAQVNEYKIKKQQTTKEPYVPTEPSMKDKILTFIGEYYIYLILGISGIVLLLMGLKKWASNKNEFDFKV